MAHNPFYGLPPCHGMGERAFPGLAGRLWGLPDESEGDLMYQYGNIYRPRPLSSGKNLEVKLDPNDVARIERMLSYVPKAIPRIFSRGLNKTATTARKESAQKLSKATGMKVNIVRRMILLVPATSRRWISKITVYARRVPYIRLCKISGVKDKAAFTAPENIPMWVKGKGMPDSPFIQMMPRGHLGIFDRMGPPRLPIREVFGPSFAEIFGGSQEIVDEIYRNASKNLAKNIENQVSLAVKQGW
jgi:hypothetical protein